MKTDFSVKSILKTIASIDPYQNSNLYTWDDIGSGLLYSEVFRDVLRHNVTAKGWMNYDGKVWRHDVGNVKAALAGEAMQRALYLYAVDKDRAYQSYVSKLGSISTRKHMIDDAAKHGAISSEMLDTETRYLNLENGIFDLNEMKLLPHDPERMLSKIAGVKYDQSASSALWDDFLTQIFSGDNAKMQFVQRAIGYSLLGSANEDCMLIFHGTTTRNGKSTFLGSIKSMLGDYGVVLPPDSLGATQRRADSPNENMADLRGSRFVWIEEPSKQMRFDAGLVKTLTGGTPIKTRKLNQANIEFRTSFVMFMAANHLPLVDDQSLFDSERLRVVTFDRHFTQQEQDHELREKLSDSDVKSAILNWALEGLADYRAHGLNTPECVTQASTDYQKQSDKIGTFIAEEMIEDPGHNESCKKVFDRYSQWCRDGGFGLENRKHFFEMLRKRHMAAKSGTVEGRTVYNVIKGYRLRGFGEIIQDADEKTPFD